MNTTVNNVLKRLASCVEVSLDAKSNNNNPSSDAVKLFLLSLIVLMYYIYSKLKDTKHLQESSLPTIKMHNTRVSNRILVPSYSTIIKLEFNTIIYVSQK